MIRKIDLQDTRWKQFAAKELKDVGLAHIVVTSSFDRDWKAFAFMTHTGHKLLRSEEAWALVGALPLAARSKLARTPKSLNWLGVEVVARTEEGLRELAKLIQEHLMTNEATPQEAAG